MKLSPEFISRLFCAAAAGGTRVAATGSTFLEDAYNFQKRRRPQWPIWFGDRETQRQRKSLRYSSRRQSTDPGEREDYQERRASSLL